MGDGGLGLACPHALQLGLDVREQEHGLDVLEQGAPDSFLRARDFLAALLLPRWHLTERVLPRGHASWSHGVFLRRRRPGRRRSLVARAGRGAVQWNGRRRRAPRGADELGDAVEPFFIDVVDGAVAQELVCREERGPCLHGSAVRVRRSLSLLPIYALAF